MEDISKMNIKTYVASGAINIEHIDHVENLFPGNPEVIASVLGGNSAKQKSLGDDDLRNIINIVLPKITSHRLWFAIIKVLMVKGYVAYDDFEGGKKLIERIYPAGYPNKFDSADLKKLHSDCFRLAPEHWTKESSPYKREAEFKQMYNLATEFQALFN
ncbi:MAG: hypothetical protein KBT12_02735 [Bacteroidales bacterium]|nr:hypothetical protein [Candidatus Physcousia equi]